MQIRAGTDLDGPVRFWPNASGPEASQCARLIGHGSGGTQPAGYQFPTLRLLVAFFHTRPCMVKLRKTSPDPTWFWLTQILAKWIRSGSKPVCKNHPARFWPTPDWMRIRCGTFTEYLNASVRHCLMFNVSHGMPSQTMWWISNTNDRFNT